MENDDLFSPILERRMILRSAASLGLLAGLGRFALARPGQVLAPRELEVDDLVDTSSMQAVCVMTPTATEGPYYLPLNLVRQNITEGYPGLATRLLISVVHASNCAPIPNASVDVWHCNAAGVYSGFANQGTQGMTFLRGVQFTDANGLATFDTIYPGWYMGRTTHIHVKVQPTGSSLLTSQTYFQQPLNRRINAYGVYAPHGQNPTTNSTDGLYLAATEMSLVATGPLQFTLTIGVA